MQKIKDILKSRKFWALISSLVAIGVGVYTNTIAPTTAIETAVAALAAYSIGTGIEDANTK